jgi:hypothetical protein
LYATRHFKLLTYPSKQKQDRLKLEKTEKRLESFMPGHRQIPDDIVVEILQWHLQGRTPRRTLALVCKGWRALLLHTSSFWRALEAYLVCPDSFEREIDTLSKRIALSRSTLLDITLTLRDNYNEDDILYDFYESPLKMDLFVLIAETGIERWRSLKLQCDRSWSWYIDQPSLEGIFRGTATALQALEFQESEGFNLLDLDPFSPIYEIILQSRPRIKEVTFTGPIPLVFRGSRIFQSASKVTANATAFQHLVPFNNLQELCINNWSSNPQYASLPPLAMHTKLCGHIPRCHLQSLQRHNVVSLRVWRISSADVDTIIDFPELISLSIDNDGIAALERISAPKLANLSLALECTDLLTRRLEISRMVYIIQNKSQNIMIRPTSLTIAIPISTTAVLELLQLWPQLQHLDLTFGNEFAWKGVFPNAFTRKNNPLCPELVTLRLQSHSDIFKINMRHWDEIAKAILAARKDFPLNRIEWRDDGGSWRRLTASN